MADSGTQHYINIERDRCATLVKMLSKEPDFLMYCIRAPVYPTENIAEHRRRFGEFAPATQVDDDFEDLM